MLRSIKRFLQNSILYPVYVAIVKRFRAFTADTFYPSIYNRHAGSPIDPNKVLFLEIDWPELSHSFEQVYTALEKAALHTHTHRARPL